MMKQQKKSFRKYLGGFLLVLSLFACVLQREAYGILSEPLPFEENNTGLPEKWIPGENSGLPVIKSQGGYGTCWALAATTAMEAALLKQEDKASDSLWFPELCSETKQENTADAMVLSADHMALRNSFDTPLSEGGDYVMIMAYLSGWQGPVPEALDPYGDAYSPDGLQPAWHVQEIQLLENPQEEEIKRAIYRYGSVQTSLYLNRSAVSAGKPYYNEITSSYYVPDPKAQNHDIVILGWDDSYSRFHFRQIPERDGAYLCQNSWGTDFGDHGRFYVSYEDVNIGKAALAYSKIEAVDNYDCIMQTDLCGWQGQQGYSDPVCWFANVYECGEESLLRAFGFYALGSDTSYELYLVRDFQDPSSFSEKQLLQSGSLKHAGYYTVDLQEPVRLASGEYYAVIVRIDTPELANPVAVEYQNGPETAQVVTEGKYGFLSPDGSRWEHTEKRFQTNVCLKAYLSK